MQIRWCAGATPPTVIGYSQGWEASVGRLQVDSQGSASSAAACPSGWFFRINQLLLCREAEGEVESSCWEQWVKQSGTPTFLSSPSCQELRHAAEGRGTSITPEVSPAHWGTAAPPTGHDMPRPLGPETRPPGHDSSAHQHHMPTYCDITDHPPCHRNSSHQHYRPRPV